MKRSISILTVLIMLLSVLPVPVLADDGNYTFTLTSSVTGTMYAGNTFTVTLTVTGDRFNDYSAEIRYGNAYNDALELLDCTSPFRNDSSGYRVFLFNQGDKTYEAGDTIAVLTFGVKDISQKKVPTIQIVNAHADIADNALYENAKAAAKSDPFKVTCMAGGTTVHVEVHVEPEGSGTAYAAKSQYSSQQITDGTIQKNSSEYSLYAVAHEGYVFKGWRLYESDKIVSTDGIWQSYTFSYDTSITAVFEPVVYDDLSNAGIQFTYSGGMPPVAGYPATLTDLPIPVNKAEYHLYKGESTDPADEIELYGYSFYMPENTDKLTLTCSYKSGSETVPMSRVIDVVTSEPVDNALVRMALPVVSNHATGYIINGSIDIYSSAVYRDPVSGEVTLYGAGGYNGGAVRSADTSVNEWIPEETAGGEMTANVYPAKAYVTGDGNGKLIWYYVSPPVSIYSYNGKNWEEMTLLEELTGSLASDNNELRILPLSGSMLFITIGKNAYIYDGESLSAIDGANYSISPNCYVAKGNNVIINDYNGEGRVDIYDASSGSLTTLSLKGQVLGADFVNGSSNVIFVKNRNDYFMYDIDSGESTSIDMSSIFSGSASTARALNRAVDGYVYALVLGNGAAPSWMPNSGIAVQGEIVYIWRTNDLGENWELVDSGNAYDHDAAAAIEGNDETPATPDPTLYSDGFWAITNPARGITMITGGYGAVCAIFGTSTITFDSMGGSEVGPITQSIRSYVSAPGSPVKEGEIFAGWYLDASYSEDSIYTFSLMPGKDITLYAKWSEDLSPAKEAAIQQLESIYGSYRESDYAPEGWEDLTDAFKAGKDAINAAESYDAVQQALSDAQDAMAAVEKLGVITVAVTVESFTVNGEYIIEPVLVSADNYEKASVVITELLKQTYPDVAEPYRINGTISTGFYLRSIYDPGYDPDPTKGQAQNHPGYLSEFDCGEQSGWMFCVNGAFPGVGASGWNLQNGDVMRWQYTCTGLGSDIGADNSAWGDTGGVKVADKDALIWRVAQINEDKEAFFAESEGNRQAYDDAMAVLKDIGASQEAVDAALVALGGTADTPEERLQKAKDAAIAALRAYDPDDYRDAEKALLEQYVSEGISAISEADSVDEVSAALSEAQAKIEKLITKEQYEAIEEASSVDIDKVYNDTAALMASSEPQSGSIGGDWTVLGLSRGGKAPEEWADEYYAEVLNYMDETIDSATGRMDPSKSTENSRLVLGLTSVGKDPTDVGGYDLTEALNDPDYLKRQGINGPVWALLAFNSHDYPTDSDGYRDTLIDMILAAQHDDGGWTLSLDGGSSPSDTDMTAMALQSLAPYYNDPAYPEVTDAVNRALTRLSNTQNSLGGYSSMGVMNSESIAQVITALTSLGIDPTEDARFIKNGNTLITALSIYAVDGGGFRHTLDGELDGMATDQAFYALTSWYRLKEGRTPLYDMTDVELDSTSSTVEKLIDAIGDPVTLDDEAKIEAARKAYESLNEDQKAEVDPDKLAKLNEAEETLSDLKVARAMELIDAIGDPVTLNDENAIGRARNYYNNQLSDAERERVENYDKLTAAEKALQKIKNETPQGHTTSVTVTINGITYEVSEATRKAVEAMQAITDPADPADRLPKDFSELTPAQEKAILEAYRLYQALTDNEKLFATNYGDFYENVLLKLGRNYHYDERTKTDARDNDDDILPWYVKLNVADERFTEEETAKIAQVLGEDFDLSSLYVISFTDVFTGEEFTPEELIGIRFPLPDMEGRKTPVFIYVHEDGSFEYIEGRVIDGELVMERTEFGRYGIADSSLSWDEIMKGGRAQNAAPNWRWLILSGAAVVGLFILFFLLKRRKDDDDEKAVR